MVIMIGLKSNFMASTATAALALSIFVNPAFAADTVHIASSNETHVEKNSWFFEERNFNTFFENIFRKKFEANLDGEQEIPGPGDVDGTGETRVKIKPRDSELCVDIEVKYIDPASAAHIHHAPKGSSGAVVVTLPIPDAEGKAEGCITVDSQLLKKIADNPQDYYVNIHNNHYPNGAIRGQLSK